MNAIDLLKIMIAGAVMALIMAMLEPHFGHIMSIVMVFVPFIAGHIICSIDRKYADKE